MPQRQWQRIFLRDNVIKEVKEVIKKHKNSRRFAYYLFKESRNLRRRLRNKYKDFVKFQDIYYIFAKELEETTGVKINYFNFRQMFKKFIKGVKK